MSFWRLWSKALGDKASPDKKEADRVAIVRTLFIILTIICELHIIANFWLTHG
jgi:hypothetical protein